MQLAAVKTVVGSISVPPQLIEIGTLTVLFADSMK